MSQPLETTTLRLGFIALNDCAPLVVAAEKGLFEAEGLSVSLSREASWANIRDKVAVGVLDGAHMLGPMPVAASLGIGGETTAMIAPMALNLNGSAITVSRAVANAMRAIDPHGMAERPRTARPLKALIEARRARGEAPLRFAVVFPYSIHNYELRYWMAASGIDPDRDVRLTVAPPPRMAGALKAGDIDGFCVTAPWNGLAVSEGTGEIMTFASEWWGMGPDKVFGLTRSWAERHPATLQAMLRALLRAAAWADAPDNRGELAALLARPAYVDAPEDIVRLSLVGPMPYAAGEMATDSRDYLVYHRNCASFPWRSHAMWFATQMVRWGQVDEDVDFAAAAAAYRPDLFRQAAAAVGDPAPLSDLKTEGAHDGPWSLETTDGPLAMAPDCFLDGGQFDPTRPLDYARRFAIRRRPAPAN
jgi:ABC-type nitrate/sulfonate/bicarbonate transport system substrate-binding protein